MSTTYISNLAKMLIKKYKTNNPFEIAKMLGIIINYKELGELKGFYKVEKRNRFIVINISLPKHIQWLVCAHELAHDQLHRELAKHTFMQEFMLCDMKSKPEYEANLFASEILLEDDDIYEHSKMGYDFNQICSILYSNPNLIALKMQAMNKRGYSFNIPIEYKSNFLSKNQLPKPN